MPRRQLPDRGQLDIFFHGKTTAARHASWTGARAVVDTWSQRQSAYLQLLEVAGALTDYEAMALLKWPSVTSVNSVRNSLGDRVISDGFDVHRFVDVNRAPRTTRRTRWRLASPRVRQ